MPYIIAEVEAATGETVAEEDVPKAVEMGIKGWGDECNACDSEECKTELECNCIPYVLSLLHDARPDEKKTIKFSFAKKMAALKKTNLKGADGEGMSKVL